MIKKKFITPPRALPTYSYTDIDEGTGVVIYYGAEHGATSDALSYFLTKTAIASNHTSKATVTVVAGGFTLIHDHDYDVTFNTIKNMKGRLRAILTMGKTSGATTNGASMYAIIKVRHWDGTTETEIANTQSQTVVLATAAANVAVSQSVNIEVNLSTITHFKRGETLRLTVEIWGDVTGTNATDLGYAFDPKDRNDIFPNSTSGKKIIEDAHSTILEFHVPFVLLDL